MHRMVVPIAAFAFVLRLVAPTAAHAEIISVPSVAASDPAPSVSSAAPTDPATSAPSATASDPTTSPPPPTVLRGSRPAPTIPGPICPPGYTVSSDYGCIAPSGGDYTEGLPGYDYWPDYGYGYPWGWFPGFGFGSGRFHRFAGFHGGPGFHGQAAFHGARGFHGQAAFHGARGFHGQAAFHGATRFGGAGMAAAHVGGFGRR